MNCTPPELPAHLSTYNSTSLVTVVAHLAWIMPLHTSRVQHIWGVLLQLAFGMACNILKVPIHLQYYPELGWIIQLTKNDGWMMDEWWMIMIHDWLWMINDEYDESWLCNLLPARTCPMIFQAHWFVLYQRTMTRSQWPWWALPGRRCWSGRSRTIFAGSAAGWVIKQWIYLKKWHSLW